MTRPSSSESAAAGVPSIQPTSTRPASGASDSRSARPARVSLPLLSAKRME